MYLCKVSNPVEFQTALDYCSDEGIKIVSCSVGFGVPLSFMAGHSGVDNSIDDGLDKNKFLSVIAAGNEADHSWFGIFQKSETSNFTKFPNGSEYLNVNVPADADIILMWDDYDNIGNSSYDIFVYTQDNERIGRTCFKDNIATNVRFDDHRRPNRLKIKILKNKDGTNESGRYMRLIFSKGNPSMDVVENLIDRNPESSLCMPADARKALTVGAVNVSNYGSGPIACYSSRGPVRNPYLLKPEI
ncbi:MAG: hypothetical protein LBT58_02770, partial [Endomicrobium sp.]|nr:hypothetical protein [Endomicrobium sp.]